MKLSHRIVLFILITISVITLANFLLTQYQKEALHSDSEKILAHTVLQSLSDALAQDIIDGNKLRVTNLIVSLRNNDNPIEFIYITKGDKRTVFAHSFKQGFPRYLMQDSNIHIQQTDLQLSARYQTQQGLIYEYTKPLIAGLDTVLHIGINQTEISEKLARNNLTILLMSLTITALALIVTYFWSRHIIAPLTSFTEQVRHFGAGKKVDFSNIDKSSPEISLLTQAFQTAIKERQQVHSALQESEERFRQLAENINEVFWLGSPSWDKIIYISPAYKKLWGQNPDELYQNPQQWIESVHPDDRAQVLEDISVDMQSISEYVDLRNFRIQTPDGKTLWIKARAYPIRDDDGQVIRVAGIAEDITRHIGMEQDLRRSQKMDAIGQLTGGIAHDYNNMLGVILGFTELLKNQVADQPKLLKYVNQIYQAGERGARLTEKLLAFSRQKHTDVEMLNINTLILEKQQMLEKTLTARIRLVFDLDKNLWPVWLDGGEFEDVMINLSINAMHAIDGNGQLTIQTQNTSLREKDARELQLIPGEYVLFSVTDTGRGIDESTKERIFEPFFSTKGDKGTGLGLSQVYAFVERSKGVIKVYSDLDQGTRIVIYFPRFQGETIDNKFSEENTEKES